MKVIIGSKEYKVTFQLEVTRLIKEKKITKWEILKTLEEYEDINKREANDGGFIYMGSEVVISGEKIAENVIEIEFAMRGSFEVINLKDQNKESCDKQ